MTARFGCPDPVANLPVQAFPQDMGPLMGICPQRVSYRSQPKSRWGFSRHARSKIRLCGAGSSRYDVISYRSSMASSIPAHSSESCTSLAVVVVESSCVTRLAVERKNGLARFLTKHWRICDPDARHLQTSSICCTLSKRAAVA